VSSWRIVALAGVFLFAVLVWHVTRRQEIVSEPSSPEDWNKTITDMGLKEERERLWPHMIIEGDYRNHRVSVYEIKYPIHGESDVGYDHRTYFDVQLKNPKKIMIYIAVPNPDYWLIITVPNVDYWWDSSKHKTIGLRVGDPIFDDQFRVLGDREYHIPTILDPSIRNRIMNIRNPPFNLVIDSGEGRPKVFNNEDDCPYRACYQVPREISEIKKDTRRFRLVIDTMIDIVEKIETST
jgi:hypothetical protein